MLPFKTLKPTEEIVIAGIPMLKRGCLTVAEMQAAADLGVRFDKENSGLSQIQADILMKQEIATIMIRSRVDRGWTLEQTKSDAWQVIVDGKQVTVEPDMQMLDELFQFYLGEQRQWKDLDELEPEDKSPKKQTGRKSTGGSGSTTPTNQDLQKTALEIAQ